MAVGILGVLSVSGTTLIYYSSANVRSAEFSKENASAYDLAEAGINEMVSVLSKPENNALKSNLLPVTTTDVRERHSDVVGDAEPIDADVGYHVDRPDRQSDGARSQRRDPDADGEGAGRPDGHPAAQQSRVGLHVLDPNGQYVRSDAEQQRRRQPRAST